MSSLLCILSIVAVVVLAAEQDCNHGHADGCSVPLHLPFFYKKAFRKACNRHDTCYSCGSGRGISKHDCDLHLKKHAINVCHHAKKRSIVADKFHNATRAFCDKIANAYYRVVDLFAANHYSTTPEDFCSESWVPACLT